MAVEVRHVSVLSGSFRTGTAGGAGQGKDWLVVERSGRLGVAGLARRGMAGRGGAWLGGDWYGRRGEAERGMAMRGMAGHGRHD